MTATTTPRVWIGCLASYNAGRLIGEWCNADDVDELNECQARVAAAAIAAAKEAGEWPVYFTEPEEFFLADNEGFGGLIGEYTPFEQVADLAQAIEEHGDAFLAYLKGVVGSFDGDVDSAVTNFEDARRGEWDSMEAYASEYVSDCGWGGLDGNQIETIFPYLDMEMIARELEQDLSEVEYNGHTYIFQVI